MMITFVSTEGGNAKNLSNNDLYSSPMSSRKSQTKEGSSYYCERRQTIMDVLCWRSTADNKAGSTPSFPWVEPCTLECLDNGQLRVDSL